ncbi:hypothetical protein JCM11491_005735 [Sporobolomyces phaffii]
MAPAPAPAAAPPKFESTTTVWPLQPTASTSKPPADASASSKSKNRNKRKKAAKPSSDGAPPSTASEPSHRTNFPWRGSGRGRGRGGASTTSRGGATGGAANASTARGFSTAATSAGAGTAGDEAGVKVHRTPLFQSAQAGANRRGLSTDAKAPAPGSDSNHAPHAGPRRGGGGGHVRGGGARGRGRGKARGPPGGDRGRPLLEKVRAKAGEEDLEAQIHALYDIQRPSPESIAAREHLITELTDYLNRERFHWGHPHSPSAMPLSIEPFGSIRFGLGTSTSDLDLCLLDPYRPNGFEDKWYSSRKEHMQDLPDIYQMRKMGNSLYRAGLENIHPIPDAAVPICKFEVQIDGQTIQADLNTNERLGVYNSRLLNSYCNLHPLVRPLSVFIKFWASQRGLNNPSGDRDGIVTFSSYTLILLVIAYLQKIKLLPNLQDEDLIASTETERTRFFSTPKAYSRRGKLKHLIRSVGWDVTFVEYDAAPDGFHVDADATLVALARGFFDHFGAEFDPTKDVVSIANGAPFARERAFGDFLPAVDPASSGSRGAPDDGSKAERVRQEMEDLALEAFADEERQQQQRVAATATSVAAGDGAAHVDDPGAELDAIAQAQSELDAERDKAIESRARSNSRSSSPIPYGDFAEPDKWTEHLLVVQDPFILTRNCAGNVRPDWVEELRIQMRRARDLIDANAPLSTICLHHCEDPEYLPIAFAKHRAKAAEIKKRQQEALDQRLRSEEQATKEAEDHAAETAAAAESARGDEVEADQRVEGGEAGGDGVSAPPERAQPQEVVLGEEETKPAKEEKVEA